MVKDTYHMGFCFLTDALSCCGQCDNFYTFVINTLGAGDKIFLLQPLNQTDGGVLANLQLALKFFECKCVCAAGGMVQCLEQIVLRNCQVHFTKLVVGFFLHSTVDMPNKRGTLFCISHRIFLFFI